MRGALTNNILATLGFKEAVSGSTEVPNCSLEGVGGPGGSFSLVEDSLLMIFSVFKGLRHGRSNLMCHRLCNDYISCIDSISSQCCI